MPGTDQFMTEATQIPTQDHKEQLEKEIVRLQQQIQKLENNHTIKSRDLNRVSKDLKTAEKQLTDLLVQIQEMQKIHQALNLDVIASEQRKKQTIKAHEQEIAESKQRTQTIVQNSTAQAAKLQQALDTYQPKIDAVEKQCKEEVAAHEANRTQQIKEFEAQTKQQISEKQQEIIIKASELATIQRSIQLAESKLATTNKEIAQAEQESQKATAKRDAEIKSAQENVEIAHQASLELIYEANQNTKAAEEKAKIAESEAEKRATEAKTKSEAEIAEAKKEAAAEIDKAKKQAIEAKAKSEAEIAEANKQATEAKAKSETANTKMKQTKINKTAIDISYTIGLISCIFSQYLQQALFGKVFFGNAMLFGYAVPAVNVIMASITFGLIAFALTLATIAIAKSAEGDSIFKGITENSYFKKSLQAISLITACALITKYAAAMQLALFGAVVLGGSLIANIGFAIIATAAMYGIIALATTTNQKLGFGFTMYALSFITLSIYATPIQMAVLGHTITLLVLPVLSNISFSAITSIFSASILTALYKTTEKFITPVVIEPAKTAAEFKQTVSTCIAKMTNIPASLSAMCKL